jgi:hypothetical protein
MLKIENEEITGINHAVRGMRNPMNSWDKSDSKAVDENCEDCMFKNDYTVCKHNPIHDCFKYDIGENDLDLMTRLSKAGTDHRKFMRMIAVYLDITAPLYWWKEFDTYKVGTVANSCSTMHKIHEKEFTLDDFSHEYFEDSELLPYIIDVLNTYRKLYNNDKKKSDWYQMIQLLPSSYNQKRTVMLNYEVLANIYHSRKTHKLDEWRDLCAWIENLPYSELITQCGAN